MVPPHLEFMLGNPAGALLGLSFAWESTEVKTGVENAFSFSPKWHTHNFGRMSVSRGDHVNSFCCPESSSLHTYGHVMHRHTPHLFLNKRWIIRMDFLWLASFHRLILVFIDLPFFLFYFLSTKYSASLKKKFPSIEENKLRKSLFHAHSFVYPSSLEFIFIHHFSFYTVIDT